MKFSELLRLWIATLNDEGQKNITDMFDEIAMVKTLYDEPVELVPTKVGRVAKFKNCGWIYAKFSYTIFNIYAKADEDAPVMVLEVIPFNNNWRMITQRYADEVCPNKFLKLPSSNMNFSMIHSGDILCRICEKYISMKKASQSEIANRVCDIHNALAQ